MNRIIWLLSLLPVATNGLIFYGPNDTQYLCAGTDDAYCVGLSLPLGPDVIEPGMNLQMKPRHRNIYKELNDAKSGWYYRNSSIRPLLAPERLAWGISNPPEKILTLVNHSVRAAIQTVPIAGPGDYRLRVRVVFPTKQNCCLTMTTCRVGRSADFCSLNGLRLVKNQEQIKPGSYLVCRPCETPGSIRQTFTLNPECSPGCTDRFIGDGTCQQVCNTMQCFYDLGDCFEPPDNHTNENDTETLSPSSSPSSAVASRAPSSSSSSSMAPTTQPLVVIDSTAEPTPEPTAEPTTEITIITTTAEPTPEPTTEPSPKPTPRPTFDPSQSPFRPPSGSPSFASASPSSKPSSAAPTATGQRGSTSAPAIEPKSAAPTTTAGLNQDQATKLDWTLGLVAFLVLLASVLLGIELSTWYNLRFNQ